MKRRHIGVAVAAGMLALAGGSLAPSGAQAARTPAHQSAARTVELAIRQLPPGRRTIAQLAHYYYGSRTMSFVIVAANPWLGTYPITKPLTRYGGLSQHAKVVLPTVHGQRPVGP
jgi:hypothetical protein